MVDSEPDNALAYLFQEGLGCYGCIYADKDKLGKAPCCTHLRGPHQEQGSNACTRRKSDGDEPKQDDSALIEMKRRQEEV